MNVYKSNFKSNELIHHCRFHSSKYKRIKMFNNVHIMYIVHVILVKSNYFGHTSSTALLLLCMYIVRLVNNFIVLLRVSTINNTTYDKLFKVLMMLIKTNNEYKHYTLHITHYTLHFTHSTFHITHSTLHFTHYTLHITHYTLHITHYTLHITHYTLHITHYTLHITHYMTYLCRQRTSTTTILQYYT